MQAGCDVVNVSTRAVNVNGKAPEVPVPGVPYVNRGVASNAAGSSEFSSQKILSDGQIAKLNEVASFRRPSPAAFESAASRVAPIHGYFIHVSVRNDDAGNPCLLNRVPAAVFVNA